MWKTAFLVLASFVAGNGVTYLIFGMNTMSRSDFDRSIAVINLRLDRQDESMRQLDTKVSNIAGQLTGKKLLAVP